jgi:hypothetical protein
MSPTTKGKGLKGAYNETVMAVSALRQNHIQEKDRYRKPRHSGVGIGRQTSLLFRDWSAHLTASPKKRKERELRRQSLPQGRPKLDAEGIEHARIPFDSETGQL